MDFAERVLDQIKQISDRRLARQRSGLLVPSSEINAKSRLSELGLDSLDLAELGNQLEMHLNIELTDDQSEAMFSAVTVSDVLRAVSPPAG